ncbi:MAG: glutamate synthase large subunit [Methanomethylophilus sp.]
MGNHRGLIDPAEGRASCGVGMAVNVSGSADHGIVEYGLRILENLAHRGAENADGRTGDGAGITVQIPHDFIVKCGISVPEAGRYGTGLFFLPKNAERADACLAVFRQACAHYGLTVFATREVPVDHSVPGPMAQAAEPEVRQVFVSSYDSQDTLERKLWAARRRTELGVTDPAFYICSLSTRTMVYKGMLTPAQLRAYYPDLTDPAFRSAVAMVHSRFSTNTAPEWKLAQPFRLLCHNGEINTIRANRAWTAAREGACHTPRFPDLPELLPLLQSGMSDSASLDNAAEFLTKAGLSVPNALSAMIPESWNSRNPIPDSLKAYYEYHSILMEPWDGPAAVLFTDGRLAGGMLDRNGLRPVRYTLTKDGLFILASEAGVVPVTDGNVAEAGRLRPGKMMIIDMGAGKVLRDADIKGALAAAYPYRDWLEKNCLDLADVSSGRTVDRNVPAAGRLLAEFRYTKEDIDRILIPMAQRAKEPVASAGMDIPMAVLSDRPQLFFNYFRQSFAQVTNPPIDPIREDLVMSVTGYIGPVAHGLLTPAPDDCRIVKVRHPILTDRELDLLRHLKYRGFATAVLPMTFTAAAAGVGLKRSLEGLCRQADMAVAAGASYLVLTDRPVDSIHAAIPSLLALSAVHQHLLATGQRLRTGLIVETGEAREVEHIALLFAYGANAVNPYLAFAMLNRLCETGVLRTGIDTAEHNYIRALEKGLMKIMSKMGIATIRSYRGSMQFGALGLSQDLCDRYLGGTVSPLGGIGLQEIGADVQARHAAAFAPQPADTRAIDDGIYSFCPDGERHAWNPGSVRLLHALAKTGAEDDYRAFADVVDHGLFYVRDLLEAQGRLTVPLDEVEPVELILRRFIIEGMSFGAISKEAHEVLAEAANRLGGRSNTGEGGEDPARTLPGPDGRNRRSAVRQVASGRFGVNTRYLVDADEIQIKIAQGAKPGEGGQLLGQKVDVVIAATRHTIPGITLISPPPHHDIYSIEDLKQLIYDLRCVNPQALISVKLVSEAGVGTVAAGVAKAGADIILISGGDGGTGASPMSSLRYAGAPWELGLAEAQQMLTAVGLRGRVRLQADGGFRTGRDVITAALLGADEYGFATSVLVALGCVMCRRCQTNTCPVGIATQDPTRRAKFRGTVEDVEHYLRAIAEDVRRRLAAIGLRSLQEAIGRADLLERRDISGRAALLDTGPLTAVLTDGQVGPAEGQPDVLQNALDRRIIADAAPALDTGRPLRLQYGLNNIDRSVGAMLAGEIERRGKPLADGTLEVEFTGTAGQSFGAFLVPGITFTLRGQANDFVGKGLSGGRIAIVRPGPAPAVNVVAGNTVLYGATAGELYLCGQAGERFCVRNSGAIAVAEGVGDHCCEYMTGGRAVILGPCGRNFAAGMSAGIAYVLDETGDFDRHCNMDMVELELVEMPADREELRSILDAHVRYTGSPKAKALLADWDTSVRHFLKVMPIGYKKLLESRAV